MRTRFLAFALAVLAAGLPAAPLARPGVAARSRGWSVELVDEGGSVLPTFEHRGRTYVLGTRGRRYAVRFRNGSGARVEVVLSVDGRDAVDGRPSSLAKRGYVVDPYGEVTVDGFRLSEASVAAFRFGTVAGSYAARMGDARDVGVVGVAVFAEARPPPRPEPSYPLRREAAPGAGLEPAPGEAPGRSGDARASAAPERAPSPGDAKERARPGLGTEFGEERESAVARVSFERGSTTPEAVLTLRYDDRAGLVALGIDVDRAWAGRDEVWRRERADPFRRDASYSAPPPGWRP